MNLIEKTIEHHRKDVNADGRLTLEEEREIEVESGPRPRKKKFENPRREEAA